MVCYLRKTGFNVPGLGLLMTENQFREDIVFQQIISANM